MTSTRLMLWLIANYAVITVASIVERRYARALYYVGAIVISFALLWMTETARTGRE